MGFKSKTQSNIRKHKVNNLIFPSRTIFLIIESINRDLNFLYSPTRTNSLCSFICYSPVRDNNEEFNIILDRVEEQMNRIKEEVNIIETDDSAFNDEFPTIVSFLDEAFDYEYNTESDIFKQTPEDIKKRFISIAHKLWDLGVRPGEF